LADAGNLYGRPIHGCLCRHRFLPGSKGGLYGWAQAAGFARIVVVEGLFDIAALWQAGFPNTIAVLGSHLNKRQLAQLCQSRDRLIYICFDADRNGSGQRAAHGLSMQLQQAGIEARRVALPLGHDPASFFAAGATACDFGRCLERARPVCPPAVPPFRIVDEQDRELEWANRFLDMQCVRGVTPLTLRGYANTLLHFVRWWSKRPGVDIARFGADQFTETTLIDYVRDQRNELPQPGPQNINQRSSMLRRLFRFYFHEEMPHGPYRLPQRTSFQRSPLGYGRGRRAVVAELTLKVPQRVIVPLSAEQVARFCPHELRQLIDQSKLHLKEGNPSGLELELLF